MNKAKLIDVLAEKVGVSKKQAEDMIESFTAVVTQELKKGGEVTLTGFGTFSAKTRKPRVGVNPQNPSQSIEVPAVTVAKFKAGKALKDELKNSHMNRESSEEAPVPAPEVSEAPAEETIEAQEPRQEGEV